MALIDITALERFWGRVKTWISEKYIAKGTGKNVVLADGTTIPQSEISGGVVKTEGDQTVGGSKTFTSPIKINTGDTNGVQVTTNSSGQSAAIKIYNSAAKLIASLFKNADGFYLYNTNGTEQVRIGLKDTLEPVYYSASGGFKTLFHEGNLDVSKLVKTVGVQTISGATTLLTEDENTGGVPLVIKSNVNYGGMYAVGAHFYGGNTALGGIVAVDTDGGYFGLSNSYAHTYLELQNNGKLTYSTGTGSTYKQNEVFHEGNLDVSKLVKADEDGNVKIESGKNIGVEGGAKVEMGEYRVRISGGSEAMPAALINGVSVGPVLGFQQDGGDSLGEIGVVSGELYLYNAKSKGQFVLPDSGGWKISTYGDSEVIHVSGDQNGNIFVEGAISEGGTKLSDKYVGKTGAQSISDTLSVLRLKAKDSVTSGEGSGFAQMGYEAGEAYFMDNTSGGQLVFLANGNWNISNYGDTVVKFIEGNLSGDIVVTGGLTNKVVNVSGTTAELKPNRMYKFGTVNSLTITFGEEVSDCENEYKFKFTAGVDDMPMGLPDGIKWQYGVGAPVISAGHIYEISIKDNCATYLEFA